MSLSRTKFSINSHDYYFDLVCKDKNTYSIQIADANDQIIADLPLDPMDNTLAAVLSKDAIAKFGDDAPLVLQNLAEWLQANIGAKEFILVPTGVALPGYVPAQEAEFKRLRHASRADLEMNSSIILAQYKELVQELDDQYQLVEGIDTLEKKLQYDKPYEEIFALLKNHADFTPGKMNEYKEEDVEGTKVRFNNSNVKTMALLNQQHRLVGIVRSLSMGNKFAYLSDETIKQELLPLEKFSGRTPEEQVKNRAIFLLAYLAYKACQKVKDQDHFLMVAADKREAIYDAVGLKTFPIESCDYQVLIKLTKPAPLLTSIKEQMLKSSFSNANAVSNFGILPMPNQTQTLMEQPQQITPILGKNFNH